MSTIAMIIVWMAMATQSCKGFETPVQAEDGSWIACPSEYWSDVPPTVPAPKPSFDRYQ